MDSGQVVRGVWAAMEDGRERTLADMSAFNLPPLAVAKWLQVLITNGYAKMGIRLIDGNPETTFRIARYTGPSAPHLDEMGVFVDPNLQKNRKPFQRPRKAIALAAQVHAISRRIKKRQFTRAWMLEQVGQKHARRLTETCRTLIQRGFLARGPAKDVFLVVGTDSVYDAAHEAVMEKIDQGPFYFTEISTRLEINMASRTVGFIMDWIRAEGYEVTSKWDHRTSNTIYRITSPSSTGETDARQI